MTKIVQVKVFNPLDAEGDGDILGADKKSPIVYPVGSFPRIDSDFGEASPVQLEVEHLGIMEGRPGSEPFDQVRGAGYFIDDFEHVIFCERNAALARIRRLGLTLQPERRSSARSRSTRDGKPNLAAPAQGAPDGKPDLSGVWEPEATPLRELNRVLAACKDRSLTVAAL